MRNMKNRDDDPNAIDGSMQAMNGAQQEMPIPPPMPMPMGVPMQRQQHSMAIGEICTASEGLDMGMEGPSAGSSRPAPSYSSILSPSNGVQGGQQAADGRGQVHQWTDEATFYLLRYMMSVGITTLSIPRGWHEKESESRLQWVESAVIQLSLTGFKTDAHHVYLRVRTLRDRFGVGQDSFMHCYMTFAQSCDPNRTMFSQLSMIYEELTTLRKENASLRKSMAKHGDRVVRWSNIQDPHELQSEVRSYASRCETLSLLILLSGGCCYDPSLARYGSQIGTDRTKLPDDNPEEQREHPLQAIVQTVSSLSNRYRADVIKACIEAHALQCRISNINLKDDPEMYNVVNSRLACRQLQSVNLPDIVSKLVEFATENIQGLKNSHRIMPFLVHDWCQQGLCTDIRNMRYSEQVHEFAENLRSNTQGKGYRFMRGRASKGKLTPGNTNARLSPSTTYMNLPLPSPSTIMKIRKRRRQIELASMMGAAADKDAMKKPAAPPPEMPAAPM